MSERQCVCGHAKRPEFAFCQRCYFTLPATIRRHLWRYRRGSYMEAVNWLRNSGILNPAQVRAALDELQEPAA